MPNTTIIVPSTLGPTSSPNSDAAKSHVGAIAGGVIGGLALLALIAGGGTLLYRRRRPRTTRPGTTSPSPFKEEAGDTLPYPYEREYASRSGAAPPEVFGASKARERARLLQQQQQRHADPMSSFLSSEAGHSGQVLSSEDLGSGTEGSTFLAGLRYEMEHLRRLMQGLREERLQPPPDYAVAGWIGDGHVGQTLSG